MFGCLISILCQALTLLVDPHEAETIRPTSDRSCDVLLIALGFLKGPAFLLLIPPGCTAALPLRLTFTAEVMRPSVVLADTGDVQ